MILGTLGIPEAGSVQFRAPPRLAWENCLSSEKEQSGKPVSFPKPLLSGPLR